MRSNLDLIRSARAMEEVHEELIFATEKFPRPHSSAHEGYAVILEELDELWDEVKHDGRPEAMREEAKQVASSAIRFMVELT